jgi:hypothetical protein
MGRITTQIDNKLRQIEEIKGAPDFINVSSTVELELREELDDKTLMAGNGGMTPYSSDNASLVYRNLPVTVVNNEAVDFLSITYKNAQGVQKEL